MARVHGRIVERGGQRTGQRAHLTIHNDGIQALFAAEMLIHNRLGDFGVRGDFLHAYRFEAFGGE